MNGIQEVASSILVSSTTEITPFPTTMKILLVKPPLNRNLLAPNHDEPLEIEYLGAAVPDHDVRILDMRFDGRLDRALSGFRPDLVGITAYTCDYNVAVRSSRRSRNSTRGSRRPWGAITPRCSLADFARPFVDVIFLGAADDSFREFVARSESGRPVEEVPNLAFVERRILALHGQGARRAEPRPPPVSRQAPDP